MRYPTRLAAGLCVCLAQIAVQAGEAVATTNQAPMPTGPEASVVGWRGNGTGSFPDAKPPITWRKVGTSVARLRCQAEKPKDEKPSGISAANGAFTEWMVLGPLKAKGKTDKEALAEAFVEDEANWQPTCEESIGGKKWRNVKTPGTILDFTGVFAEELPHRKPGWDKQVVFNDPYVAYACTHVYSPEPVTLKYATHWGGECRIWVNGEQLSYSVLTDRKQLKLKELKLNRGWNRVLYKAANTPVTQKPKAGRNPWTFWFVELEVRADPACEKEASNILWQTRTPYYHIACPLVVGDNVFVMSKPADLICMNKSDGKVRWIRSTTYYDLMGKEEEKKKHQALETIPPLVEKLKKLNARYVEQNGLEHKDMRARQSLFNQILKIMGEVDKKKFGGRLGHYVKGAMPTPVSDGKHVYIWTQGGMASCFDLNGNRKWITMPETRHGGRYQSPTFAGGKMIFFEHGHLFALAKDSGEVAWKTPTKGTSQSPVRLPIGDRTHVFFNDTIFNTVDGKPIWTGTPQYRNNITTAVVENSSIYNVGKKCSVTAKPDGTLSVKKQGLWSGSKWLKLPKPQSFIPSSVHHDGLLYDVAVDGWLYVSDAEKGGLVYRKDLGMGKEYYYDYYHHPFGRVNASLVAAGGHIYVWGMAGLTVVFKAGRSYQEVSRNMIGETTGLNGRYGWRLVPENFGSTPVVDGDRFYVRGSTHLYCIGTAR